MPWKFLLLLFLVPRCCAQFCMPEGSPQPDSAYAFIRAEIKALKSIRDGLSESARIPSPIASANDPKKFKKTVDFYSVVERVKRDYDCAAMFLSNYKASKNDSIRLSAEALLEAIDTTQGLNAKLVDTMEQINKATKPEDIDQTAIAKMLADLKGLQKDAAFLSLAAVRMSTFTFLKVEGPDDEAKPVAFTITAKQRSKLLEEVQELATAKIKDQYTYVDGCSELLRKALTQELPASVK